MGLVDMEVYDDHSASATFVVAPGYRRRGVGQTILEAVEHLDLVQDVNVSRGSVDSDNVASIHCLRGAGHTVTDALDHQGLLPVAKMLEQT